MKKKTKFALFAAASAGLALAGAKLWQMIRFQNDELNEMIRQEPGHSAPPMEDLDEDDFVHPEDEEEEEEDEVLSEEEEDENEPL